MILALVQARMSSTRLPGKVMKKVLVKPLIGYLLERLTYAKKIDKIIVATSRKKENDEMCDYVRSIGFKVYRGSENDVLNRFYYISREYNPDGIVRITADCPLILPVLIDRACDSFLKKRPDYLGYRLPYPEGLADISVCSFKALETAWNEAKLPSEREHVVTYLFNNPQRFKIARLKIESSINDYRYTVDENLDFEVVKKIIEDLYQPGKFFGLKEIEKYSKEHPEIVNLNKHITRNEGYQKSLMEDEKFISRKR